VTQHLLVFADDWGRHPSSCQHLVRHLLDDHPVVWVNTIGTRAPRLDLATIRRATGKLRQWLGPRRESASVPVPANLRIVNPKMWPWLTRPFDRALNRKLLAKQLLSLIRELPEPPVAITTLPVVADVMPLLPVKRWVYYCVDDFGQWPGLDRATMTAMEKRVVAGADRIVAVSENLRERLATLGRDSTLLTHGVDPDIWTASTATIDLPDGLERPLVVFWGVIDRRMETSLVRQLAADMTSGTILLVGPMQDPDPALLAIPRVRTLGAVPFESLPALANQAAVLVMPYADLPVTRAMQPLKLKEYLATGKPVVARDLPANRDWADALDLVTSPAQFSQRVRERIASGVPPEQTAARRRLQSERWSEKARQFREMILRTI
jgi:glycosyltransferase involved in cell wall biosynthesis